MRTIPPEEIKLVNCASCDQTLIGETTRDRILNENLSLGCKGYLPYFGGWATDPAFGPKHRRPYCKECLQRVRMAA